MKDSDRSGDAPAQGVMTWIETMLGGKVVRTQRHVAGTRWAWIVAVEKHGAVTEMFLRHDAGRSGDQEALKSEVAVLRALGSTAVPVPKIHAVDESGQYVLMDCVRGSSDYDSLPGASKEEVAEDFLQVLAKLHALDVHELKDLGLSIPRTPAEHLTLGLEWYEAGYRRSARPDPVVEVGLRWARANAPKSVARTALLQGDTGPGNFMFDSGRITALVDWEMAHIGDPLEDLAWIAARAFMQPFGDLVTRFRRYEEISGIKVDFQRVRYWTVIAALNNLMGESIYIQIGLDEPSYPYNLSGWCFHRRLVVEAVTGCESPLKAQSFALQKPPADERALRLEVVARQLKSLVLPNVQSPAGQHTTRLLHGLVRHVALAEQMDPIFDEEERIDLKRLLGANVDDPHRGRAELAARIRAGSIGDKSALNDYLVANMRRQAARIAPLMGRFAEMTNPSFNT